MHILVTGATGYLGSRLLPELIRGGHEVVAVDCLMFGGESLLALLDHPRFHFQRGDIRNRELMKQLMKSADAVVHLAALVGDEACATKPAIAREINTAATLEIFELASYMKANKFIFVSTCSNYGLTSLESVATEDSQLFPQSEYATSKIEAEKTLISNSTKEIGLYVLRLGTLFGLSPRMRFNLLVNELARAAVMNNRMVIYAPNAWRPYLHVIDAVDAILTVLRLENEATQDKVFNVVGENLRKIDLVNLVRIHVPQFQVEFVSQGADRRDYRVSASRIKEEIGFCANRSVEEGLEEMIDALHNGVFTNAYDSRFDAHVSWQTLDAMEDEGANG